MTGSGLKSIEAVAEAAGNVVPIARQEGRREVEMVEKERNGVKEADRMSDILIGNGTVVTLGSDNQAD